MNSGRVTRSGLEGARPGREALPGGTYVVEGLVRRRHRRDHRGKGKRAEEAFRSYYGRPVIKKPVWQAREIAGYFFLGGLAGASSLLAAGASVTGRPRLARGAKLGAAGAIGLSLAALIKDLGRPARFLNMLRVFKPTSPMSVGTWVVASYAPAAALAALAEVADIPPALATLSTVASAVLGPCVATYTGVLIADTAVPLWHGAHRELPFVFASSAAMSAGGLGLLVAPEPEFGPARRLALTGAVAELLSHAVMERRLGPLARPLHEGSANTMLRSAKTLTLVGIVGSLFARRARAARALSGLALLGASACTRFGIFYAGAASATDPEATIGPQRERLQRSRSATEASPTL